MANENEKKYAGLETLRSFKENADKLYATQENVDEISSILEEKANTSHIHDISDVTNLQSTFDEINNDISQKSQVQMITSDNSNNTSEILSTLKIYKLTQEEYEEKLVNGTLEDNAIYLTSDEEIDLSGYATIEQLNNKSDVSHNHNDMYYTETEIDVKVSDINTSISNSLNDAKLYSDANLNISKSYTDSEVSKKTQVQMIKTNTSEILSTLKIHKITQEQYNQEFANGTLDDNAIYLTPNEDIDLSVYATVEQLNNKADTEHSHDVNDVNGLQSTLDTISANISKKADASHSHEISEITNLQTSLDGKVSTNRTINGKALNGNITLSATDVGADVSGSANNVLNEAKIYTDNAVTQRTQVQIITWEDDD